MLTHDHLKGAIFLSNVPLFSKGVIIILPYTKYSLDNFTQLTKLELPVANHEPDNNSLLPFQLKKLFTWSKRETKRNILEMD